MADVSALGPIDPTSLTEGDEKEKAAPWIVRKLVGVSENPFQVSHQSTGKGALATVRGIHSP